MAADLKIERAPSQIAAATSPVRVAEHRKDGQGRVISAGGSNDLESLAGITFNEDIVAVTINNTSVRTIFYKADGGTATSSSFPIASGQVYMAFGDRATLRNIRLFASPASSGGIQEHVLIT